MCNVRTLICGIPCLLVFCFAVFLPACKKNNPPEPTEISSTLSDIRLKMDHLYKHGQQDSAIRYLDLAAAKLQLTAVEQWSILNTKTAYFLNYKRRPDSALKYADSLVKVVKDKPNLVSRYISALFVRGDVLMDLGLYEDAFDAYIRADKILQSTASCYTMAARIGFLRYKQGSHEAAIPYIKKGFEEKLACANAASFEEALVSPQSLLNTLGLCFEQLNQPDSALFYYQKALAFIDERKQMFPKQKNFPIQAKGVIYGNMATAFLQKGQPKQAEELLLKSIEINSKKGFEVRDAQTAKIKLISLYSDNGQNPQARKLIREIEDLSLYDQKELSSASILKFYFVKWKFYDRVHDTEKAYTNLERFHLLKDSIETFNKVHQYVDVEHGLRDADKAQVIELLKKDAQSKKFLILGAGLVIILIFTILYIVLRNLKRSKANIDELKVSKDLVQNQYVQLTQVYNVLEKSHLENSNIMKVVAHDLRGPVSGMTNAARLMLTEDGLTESNYRMLHLVESAGINALSLINEMLRTHHSLGETEPIDIYMLLSDCISLLQFRAEAKAQKIVLAADHITVKVNQDKIARVISNLLTNAIKFSFDKGIISVVVVQGEGEVVVSITDEGIGIPAHLENGVFDMFSKSGRVGTALEESFGMGLAISKQIIEKHGGRIWYTSQVGLGTTFYFSLPL